MLEAHRARTAWLKGVRALRQGQRSMAAIQFEKAATFDKGMADAWLGMHALGVKEEQAVAAMARHEGRIGEERRRQHLPLSSRFDIGPYVNVVLENHHDLWCAVAAGHLDRNEHNYAAAAIERTSNSTDNGLYLRGRHAFDTGDTDEAIRWFRFVIDDGEYFLKISAMLMSGILLAEVGAIAPAKEYLSSVLRADQVRPAHVSARYWLGVIAREEGDEQAALNYFHRAYAQDPTYPGLKDAMEAHQPQVRVRVARAEAADTDVQPQPSAAEEPTESVEQVLADLDQQVGQEGVKQQVRTLLAQTRAQIARAHAGLQQPRMTKHFVFSGPPGTGKTTIARVIARLYKALGILDNGHVIEVDRSGLVGEYLGHTPAKTQQVLDSAMGGVLLIDEAYALKTDGFNGGDAFGQEAIDTILKRMEDDRDKFVVIAAGYPEPMRRFLGSNPGLKSRFTTTVEFLSYSAGELVQIADVMAGRSGDILTDDARQSLHNGLSDMEARGDFTSNTFGNARFVRTLLERAAEVRNLRIFGADAPPNPDHAAMVHLTAADIRAAAYEMI